MTGRITSIESMGLVDGPGIRAVIFFAGCALRCSFCHNPETWSTSGGEEFTVEQIMARILRFKPYFEKSGGGVTFSGGEPLLQPEFLTELLLQCRERGIHTCLDTAGVGLGDYKRILELTDLVLYDVKATGGDEYRKICGGDIEKTERFLTALREVGTPTIVRQVVIGGVNDSDEYMRSLKNYVREKIPTAVGVELLPYHTLGSHKYRELGIKEPLAGVPQMPRSVCEGLWERYFKDVNN